MAQSILIFDFGTNEEAAQQARHKVEAWSQGFRLGKKILLKFDREEASEESDGATAAPKSSPEGKAKDKSEKKTGTKKAESSDAEDAADKREKSDGVRVRVLIKLDFSDHEKLSSQRWLDRIPSEEPFKSAKSETVRQGNSAFADVSKRFDLLD
jgi:hypothetical protein